MTDSSAVRLKRVGHTWFLHRPKICLKPNARPREINNHHCGVIRNNSIEVFCADRSRPVLNKGPDHAFVRRCVVARAHFGSCFLKVIYSFSDHNLLPNLVLSGALQRVRSK
jgi:hypothetical protein